MAKVKEIHYEQVIMLEPYTPARINIIVTVDEGDDTNKVYAKARATVANMLKDAYNKYWEDKNKA